MKFKRYIAIIFSSIVLICFFLGYLKGVPESEKVLKINDLQNKDIYLIFFVNTVTIILLLVMSYVGLAIPFILKQLFTIGVAAGESGISPLIYFPTSLIHGVFELIALFLIFYVSVNNIYIIYQIVQGKADKQTYWKFNKIVLLRQLPIVITLLFVASIFEVIISNELILNYFN